MTCASCGTEHPQGTRFCLECGMRLGEACPTERAVRAGTELVDLVRRLGPGIQARAGVLAREAGSAPAATS